MVVLAKKILVVLSGKGGVGKSTVACQIALCYREQGLNVGVLDIDLCGPSIPKMLQLSDSSVLQSSSGAWVPVFYQPNSHHRSADKHNTNPENLKTNRKLEGPPFLTTGMKPNENQ